jgi:hypothetical protein
MVSNQTSGTESTSASRADVHAQSEVACSSCGLTFGESNLLHQLKCGGVNSTTAAQSALASRSDDIRAAGWTVAVHNDYRLNGEAHTFWLFTKDGRCAKGEGKTDAEALTQVRAEIKRGADIAEALPEQIADVIDRLIGDSLLSWAGGRFDGNDEPFANAAHERAYLLDHIKKAISAGVVTAALTANADRPKVMVTLGDLHADDCKVCGGRGEFGIATQRGPDGCNEALNTGEVYCDAHFPHIEMNSMAEQSLTSTFAHALAAEQVEPANAASDGPGGAAHTRDRTADLNREERAIIGRVKRNGALIPCSNAEAAMCAKLAELGVLARDTSATNMTFILANQPNLTGDDT